MADAGDVSQRRFGHPLRLRRHNANARYWRWLEQLWQDVRFGARTLRRSPGFTTTAALTLALATGATTAIFSIVYGVLLQPLPFTQPDRLVQVYGRNWGDDRGGVPDPITGPVASLELEAFAKESAAFDGFTGYATTTRHLEGPSAPERLTAVMADGAFFPLLGVAALAGRTFRSDDPPNVAVISASLWQRRFGSDPAVIGRAVILDGAAVTIIGVMPETFQFPYSAASGLPGALPESRTDIWVPIAPVRASASGALRQGRINVTGRLKPAVALSAAQAELRVIAGRVEAQLPSDRRRRIGVRLEPLAEVVVGPIRRSLWLLFAAVGLVLATACANVANLLLARMTVRRREVATRAALGASRPRLVRQFLAESLLLSLAGGALGAAVARWGTDLLIGLGSAKIPRAHEIALDWRAFAFLLTACLATAVLFGLAPALTAARADAHDLTKESAGHATMGRRYGRIRDGLVAAEVALAFVLALGAVLVMREAIRLRNIPTGMTTENVLALHLTPATTAQNYYAIEERVARLTGVAAAGLIQLVPLQNWGWEAGFVVRGRPRDERPAPPTAELRYVTPGYFRTLGIPIVRGRGFTTGDTADAPRVILINQALERRYFPNEDPVGRETDRGTIAGIVGDVRDVGLDRPTVAEIYYPAAQNVAMTSDIGMSLMVRLNSEVSPPLDRIRSAVGAINPKLAIFNVKSMEQVVADSLWELNLYRWLIGLFAALALVLAAIGLYGVLSYHVTSRTREFAVRLALGSDPMGLARLVLGRAVRLSGAGLAAGMIAACAATPLLRQLPIGGGPGAATYAVTAVVLLGIALLASVVPAIRVAGVNPATALRHD